jgi:hypothetical protein
MKHLTLILLSIALISCNPFISKDVRKAKRCNKKLEKLTEKCPDLLKTDTIEVPFEVIVPELVIEHEIEIRIDSNSVDSLLCELDKVKEQKDKIRFVTEFIKSNYVLDTLITDSLYNATISIKNGVLLFNVTIHEQTIKEKVKVEDKKAVLIELSWYDKLLIYSTKYWWLLLIIGIIFLSIKYGVKLFL